MENLLRSITLLGSSSGRNAGDAALMSGIMDPVDEACARRLRYEIPTIRPRFVKNTYQNHVVPVGMLPWNMSIKMLGVPTYQSIMRTDLSLVFDAILFDRALFNPLFNFMSTLSLLLPKAKAKGKKLAFYNVGTGPVNTRLGKKMLRELADMMDFVTVRDQASHDILMDIGVSNPRVVIAADAALGVKPATAERVDEIIRQIGLEGQGEILAININAYLDTWADSQKKSGKSMGKEAFLATYAAALNRVIPKLGVPVLFVVTQHHDMAITNELIARLRVREKIALLSNLTYNHFEIKGVLSRVSLLFGMRLHAMILGSSVFTPIVGLAYQPKIAHYFHTLGMQSYFLSFDQFQAENLEQLVLSGWEKREALKASLRQRIPYQIERSNIASRLVAALDRNENLDQVINSYVQQQSQTHPLSALGSVNA